MEEGESWSSSRVSRQRADSSPTHLRQQRHKVEVYNEVLRRLKDSSCDAVHSPGFEDELLAHFNRLPPRYALDVNSERAEDVLTHKRLLQLAEDPEHRPVFDVRVVDILPAMGGRSPDLSHSEFPRSENQYGASGCPIPRVSTHPPPAFGSSPNLEALILEVSKKSNSAGDDETDDDRIFARPMHEITFSSDDKPKLLSQLTSLLADIGLNIQEAHAFSTTGDMRGLFKPSLQGFHSQLRSTNSQNLPTFSFDQTAFVRISRARLKFTTGLIIESRIALAIVASLLCRAMS